MEYINEEVVLDFYLKEIANDKVSYLVGRDMYKNKIISLVKALKKGGQINDKVNTAKDLWKCLFEASMTYIDPDRGGYDKLFKYFDDYVDFEELIFASDSFYRDHTFHCLWVYFLGEYIAKNEEFAEITKNMDKTEKKSIDFFELFIKAGILKYNDYIKVIYDSVKGKWDKSESTRCIVALTHDLGYPLKKIGKINKSMQKILPRFSINQYNDFNFSYNDIEQIYIRAFIERISNTTNFQMGFNDDKVQVDQKIKQQLDGKIQEFFTQSFAKKDGNISASADSIVNKDVNVQFTPEESELLTDMVEMTLRLDYSEKEFWKYSQSFEKYDHGIMSAFLLVKNLRTMCNSSVRKTNMGEIKSSVSEFMKEALKNQILAAVADHTCEYYRITDFSDQSSFLILIDELEEFSRMSKANQNRQFVEEFCNTSMYMKDGWFNIDFIFDNEDVPGLDPERAFKGKCEKMFSVMDIPNLREDLKIRFRFIGKLHNNNNTYTLEIAHKYGCIKINDEEKDIPSYLKKREFYSREEYENM